MDSNKESLSLVNGFHENSQKSPTPKPITLELIKGPIPVPYNRIEAAVRNFCFEIDVMGNDTGFFNQTIENIAKATFLKGDGDFWLAHDGASVYAYMLGSISRDIDSRLTYWCSQGWVHPSMRNRKCVKEWMETIRQHAKSNFCKHFMITASRNPEPFCRWMGNGTHIYAVMLKQDI